MRLATLSLSLISLSGHLDPLVSNCSIRVHSGWCCKILCSDLGGLNLEPYPSGESFCASIAFSRLKSYFSVLGSSLLLLLPCHFKDKFWSCGHWTCLLSDLLDDVNELSWEGPLTVVLAVAGLLVGSLVGVIVVFLVV